MEKVLIDSYQCVNETEKTTCFHDFIRALPELRAALAANVRAALEADPAAKSFDELILYSNATILGGSTVIGARSIIGGHVWIAESVAPDTKVLLKRPGLAHTGNNNNSARKKTVV